MKIAPLWYAKPRKCYHFAYGGGGHMEGYPSAVPGAVEKQGRWRQEARLAVRGEVGLLTGRWACSQGRQHPAVSTCVCGCDRGRN